jgi:Domain of unknown function (DUF1840)
MLIRFKSPAAADVLMLGDSALEVLRLVGREGQHKGIFEVDAQLGVVALIDAAVAAESSALAAPAGSEGSVSPPRPSVSLRQRVWPLRELLLQSHRERVAVVWGV